MKIDEEKIMRFVEEGVEAIRGKEVAVPVGALTDKELVQAYGIAIRFMDDGKTVDKKAFEDEFRRRATLYTAAMLASDGLLK